MLRFDPNQAPVVPRDAATVIVVREGPNGVEMFCVERHARSGFLGGAVVFPGGKLDEADRFPVWATRSTTLRARSRAFAAEHDDARGFAIAALRELFEEGAILPVEGDSIDATRALSLRVELEARAARGVAPAVAFSELMTERDLRPDTARLEALWRWITPAAEARRYDTRFYVLPLPPAQSGAHDRHETTSSFWATPNELLRRYEHGELFLAPPTMRTAELFRDCESVTRALELAALQSLEPVCPVFVTDGDNTVLTLPGDALHPDLYAPPADPLAPTRFELVDGRFVSRRKPR